MLRNILKLSDYLPTVVFFPKVVNLTPSMLVIEHFQDDPFIPDQLLPKLGDASRHHPTAGNELSNTCKTFRPVFLLELLPSSDLAVYNICRILLQHDVSILSQETTGHLYTKHRFKQLMTVIYCEVFSVM